MTDINDRDKDILERAKQQNMPWNKLADYWTKKFLKDMEKLNWVKPTNYLKASDNIDSMIRIIESLLNKKIAYSAKSGVYLEISKIKNFGKLSGFTKSKMLKIAKDFDEDIENPDKKNPLDITLWRNASQNQPAHIPSFKSPYGLGRPGWHIECSAMSTNTLGGQIDIHGGGIDLIYPHHEAEIAQSEGATGRIPFSKFWIHTAPVSYKGEKMSKSLGNLIMVSDLIKKYSADTIRWYLISRHYRKPFEFFENDLEKAKIEFSSILKFVNNKNRNSIDEEILSKFIKALEDDLNTPLALSILKKFLKKISSLTLKKSLLLLGFHLKNV